MLDAGDLRHLALDRTGGHHENPATIFLAASGGQDEVFGFGIAIDMGNGGVEFHLYTEMLAEILDILRQGTCVGEYFLRIATVLERIIVRQQAVPFEAEVEVRFIEPVVHLVERIQAAMPWIFFEEGSHPLGAFQNAVIASGGFQEIAQLDSGGSTADYDIIMERHAVNQLCCCDRKPHLSQRPGIWKNGVGPPQNIMRLASSEASSTPPSMPLIVRIGHWIDGLCV